MWFIATYLGRNLIYVISTEHIFLPIDWLSKLFIPVIITHKLSLKYGNILNLNVHLVLLFKKSVKLQLPVLKFVWQSRFLGLSIRSTCGPPSEEHCYERVVDMSRIVFFQQTLISSLAILNI